jgi:hypothetical protein
MKGAGIGYEKRDNCFARIDDLPRAQKMMEELEQRKWEPFLNLLARRANRLVVPESGLNLRGYYWSVRESEYATDVMFKDAASLERLYPALLDHAIKNFGCSNVLRFLGRRTHESRFRGDAGTSLLRRSEGVRVKHWAEENSIKMYDKQGSVLRIEMTMNNPRRFKVRRMTEWSGVRRMRWIPMRWGVVDLDRRVEVSRAATERYIEALAMVNVPSPVREVLDGVSRRIVKDGRPYRALRPVSPEDAKAFQAVMRGQFLIKGFMNRDLRECLGTTKVADETGARRASGRATRLLRLFRAHGLIRKVSGTRYYRATTCGHRVMTAALKVRDADVAELIA